MSDLHKVSADTVVQLLDRIDRLNDLVAEFRKRDESATRTIERLRADRDQRDREQRAAALREAADEWSEWETFVASDGIRSIRLHRKSIYEWLRDRADRIEADHG